MQRSSLYTFIFIAIIILLIIVGILIFDIGRRQPPSYASIASFEECEQAGFPVLESYPPQCTTPDGRTFTGTTSTATSTQIQTQTSSMLPQSGPTVIGTSTPITDLIHITNPAPNATVVSPVAINGLARGSFFFEASFPIKVVDAHGTVIGQGAAQAQGDWTITTFVPFTAAIMYTTPTTATGSLIFMNDNPSGDPARSIQVIIPITFSH